MVDVAGFGGPVAVGEPAGQIAHTDELVKGGRGPVLRFCAVDRLAQVPHLRAATDQFGQQWSGDDATADDDRRTRTVGRPGAVGRGVGKYVDDDTCRAGVRPGVRERGAAARTGGPPGRD